MLPPSANSGPVSDAFKAKINSLIKEQLKPIVTELAAQQQALLNNLALLKHNHNVNDYQMTRLESIRDLEQSINFKVSGVLGFDPWQHPTMGTNLREPVPADPALAPKFTPVDRATPAERAAQSAALIQEAGISARRIGVPLTFQDFPDHPSMNSGARKENPMHASIPLFGLRAPRWRAKQGLDDHATPGTAASPAGGTGLRLYNDRARELKVPLWRLIEQGADLGIRSDSSSSSPGAGTSNSPGVPGVPAGASLSNTRQMPVARRPSAPGSSSSSPSTALPAHPPLYRTYAIANIEDTISNSNPTSNSLPKPSALHRTSTMASIGSTRSTTTETSTYSSFSRVSTTATIGSEPPRPSSSSRTARATTAKPAKTKTNPKAAKAKQSTKKQRSTTRTKTPAPASSSSTLKRGRRTADLEDTADDMITDSSNQDQDEEEAEPVSKRRKRSAASDTSSGSTTTTTTLVGNEDENGHPTRRSTRLTRASAVAPPARPAPRGRATKGKKGNERS